MARRPLNTNIPAFNLAISTLLRNPSLLMPNLTVPTFLQLPEQLGPHLHPPFANAPTSTTSPAKKRRFDTPHIRALVLDKDNTLTPPNVTSIPPAYFSKLHSLRTSPSSPFNIDKNPHGILLVSNTAGSNPGNKIYEAEAQHLEAKLSELKIPVFRAPHAQSASITSSEQHRPFLKKPFSYAAVLEHFKGHGIAADEIAVVGDRLATDVLMSGLMGSWSVWLRDGVTVGTEGADAGKEGMDYRGLLAKAEVVLERYLRRRGVKPAAPAGWED